MSCLSPCSDALVIFGAALALFVALSLYWSGLIDPACRCERGKCSHRKGRSKK